VKALLNKRSFQLGFFAGLFILFLLLTAFSGEYYFLVVPFAALLFFWGWQQMKTVFFLLLLTLPFSFEYNFSASLGTDVPDELLMVFVSGVFICYCIYVPGAISKSTWRHPLLFLVFFLFCWQAVTVAFSTEVLVSVKYLLAKSWYLGAFILAPLVIFRNKGNIRAAAILIVTAVLIVTALIMLRHYRGGFRFDTINFAVVPFFRNHVNYSAMLVCMIPVLIAFYRSAKTDKRKLLIVGVLALALIALYFSYARGAWLALAAGLLAMWLIQKRFLFAAFILSLIIGLSALFWVKSNDRYLQFAHDYNKTIYHSNFREHLSATYQLKDVSTAERFYRWIAGVRMLKDNGITGYGPNTFADNYQAYAVPVFRTWVSENRDRSTVHNYFLLLAIEQGIPGLLIFLLLCGALFYYAQYLYHRIKDGFYRTVAITTGSILAMIMVVNFLSDLIETDKIGSLFFLCIAMLVVTDINTRKDSRSPTKAQRTQSNLG